MSMRFGIGLLPSLEVGPDSFQPVQHINLLTCVSGGTRGSSHGFGFLQLKNPSILRLTSAPQIGKMADPFTFQTATLP